MRKHGVWDTKETSPLWITIYHPEYSSFEDTTGITANLEDDKTVVLSLSSSVIIGPYKCVSESGDLLSIQAYSMFKEAGKISFVPYLRYLQRG